MTLNHLDRLSLAIDTEAYGTGTTPARRALLDQAAGHADDVYVYLTRGAEDRARECLHLLEDYGDQGCVRDFMRGARELLGDIMPCTLPLFGGAL